MAKKNKEFKKYSSRGFFYKLSIFWAWKAKDIYDGIKNGKVFDEFGVTMYCGRQGAGKTMAMTEYLERMRELYPEAIIVTNYGYSNQDKEFTDWNDFFEIRNAEKGVIFAIDEIQNEFSSSAWNKFPETLLQVITQQRKQRIKIVCTSQIFTRVAKQLREQCNDVVDCVTVAGRWTFTTCLDAIDYNNTIDSPTGKKKIRRLYRKNFLQDDYIRGLYGSYEVIEKISNTVYLDKIERGA